MSRLEIHRLRMATERGQELVHGVEFSVAAGEIVALVGASGSGKSLTCAGLQGLPPAGVRVVQGGAVVVDERGVRPVRPGREVATVLQGPRSAFNPVMTLAAHAAETGKAAGLTASETDIRFAEALLAAGLYDPRTPSLHPFQLSGGMLQRAMIALALLSGAPFLLADEPTSDLDLVAQARVLDLLRELADERLLGVLLVTHDIGAAARIADRVLVMEGGRIVEENEAGALLARPGHPAARRLVQAYRAIEAGAQIVVGLMEAQP